jgi:hypothetical protein
MFPLCQPALSLHQNPGDIPPEVPNVPSPQPDIDPGRTPQPEMPPPSQDQIMPDSPSGPEIMPEPTPQEVPIGPQMGAARWLH